MDLVTPDIGLIFWQTVLFLIVLFLLGKFAWKPILNALHERENTIQESLDSAKKAREEMEKLQAANESLLQEARQERDKMLKQASETAKKLVADAKEEASAEGKKMIEKAKVEIENEKKAAVVEVKNQAAALSIEIAEKILRKDLADESAQKDLVDKYLNEANLS